MPEDETTTKLAQLIAEVELDLPAREGWIAELPEEVRAQLSDLRNTVMNPQSASALASPPREAPHPPFVFRPLHGLTLGPDFGRHWERVQVEWDPSTPPLQIEGSFHWRKDESDTSRDLWFGKLYIRTVTLSDLHENAGRTLYVFADEVRKRYGLEGKI